MSKIMIVEDDDSLREIYGIRLTAEGYAVISAHDGEDALAVAVRERPDLIISDVMMPKISGFDMLDILRSTPETQNIKVIMMTALSSEDQRERGERLGADRYLVKSQVGIEDVVNVVHEVLGDRSPAGVINPAPGQVSMSSTVAAPIQPSAQPGMPNVVPPSQLDVATPAQPSAPVTTTVQPNATVPSGIPAGTTLPGQPGAASVTIPPESPVQPPVNPIQNSGF